MRRTRLYTRPGPAGWWLATAWAVAGILLLVACGSDSNTEPLKPTRTARPTFTAVPPTALCLASATAVPSATPIPTSTATATPVLTPTPTVNPYLNPLTGQLVADPTVLQRRPLLVRIGNDAEVRPQSGLSQADIVLEEATEGWYITRFTAIIWSKDPEAMRPIRSARLLTIELGHMLDGALVHSGGNDQVRWLISQSKLTDLDEYFHPQPYYQIEPEGKWKNYPWMGTPGTSAKRLRDYLLKTGQEKTVHLAGFTFSHQGDPAPQGEPATYVRVPYPSRALVEFRYDAERHLYRRWVQGEPHVDALNGEQLAAANVIVQYSQYEQTDVKDSNGQYSYNIHSTGEGRAQIFRDGVLIEARWVRPTVTDFVRYLYRDGSPVPLLPGQSWIEVVPVEYKVTFEH